MKVTCTTCGKTKDVSKFYPNYRGKQAYRQPCKKCHALAKKRVETEESDSVFMKSKKKPLVDNYITQVKLDEAVLRSWGIDPAIADWEEVDKYLKLGMCQGRKK